MAEETATFSLKVDADAAPAAEAAAELEKFRAAIVKSQSALAEYRKSQSLLKGSSAEVTDAKAKLRAAIELEKSKITQANLGILKLGGSYEKLAKAQKKDRAETDAGRKAITAVGGPMKGLLERFDGMKSLLPVLASGWGVLAGALALGVAGMALAAVTVTDLTLKFTEWLATTADANRNLALTREAFSGSAKNATAWGHIIDWASEKTALTTAQLNELVVATEKTYRGFRISGQGMVDAFKASALAAGAGRADVAAFFDEIISRGKLTGRSFVSAADFARFRNAGIPVEQMYKALGITAAQAARGAVVSTDKMAAALRKLSENRFADINAKKMLSLGAQWDHFKDNLMRLTNDLIGEGGALEPLLKSIAEVAKMFDLSTESGQELKKAVTEYGKAAAAAITAHLPDIKAFVLNVIKLTGAFISGAAAVIAWTQSTEGLTTIKILLIAIAAAAAAVFVAFLPLIIVGIAIAAVFVLVGAAIYGVYKLGQWLKGLNWGDIGTAIVTGIKNGLEAAWAGLKNAVTAMGEGIKSTFRKILGIASPSREFAMYGLQSGQGYQQGLQRSTPQATEAATAMGTQAKSAIAPSAAGTPPPPPATGASGGVHIGTIENHFHIPPGKGAEETKAALSSASFLEQLEKSFRAVLQTQGIPTGSPVPSGG
jgi:hypothetical protein